ncbi:MAG TPA: Ig-like domain-containing protein [Candidatus Kryptonia bacterium]
MKYISTFCLLLTVITVMSSPSAATIPTTAKGMWIWQIWNAEGGNLDAIISRLKATGVTWVAVKLGDSNSEWNTPGHSFYTWVTGYNGLDSVIARFHRNGIKFFGWQYVYGAPQYSGSEPTEADVSNDILDVNGMDGFIIDAEVEFEASGMDAVAANYVDSIRAVHPHSFVALTSFARVSSHPIPWTTFLKSCDVNMPQAYWALRPESPSQEFTTMRNEFESWEQIWINGGYPASIKPIVPIGCEYGEGDGYNEQFGDISQFSSLSQNAGYVGMSLWEYTEMDTMNWRDYASSWASNPPVVPEVAGASPPGGPNIPAYDTVMINFNTPMDAGSVNGAFSITPPVSGTLTFNPDFNRWIFVPDTLLQWSTEYTVAIDTSAESLLGAHLSSRYTLTFTTVPRDTSPAVLLAISPGNDGLSSSHTYFEFILNKPVSYNSFVQHLSFVDSTGKKISLARDMFQLTRNNLSLIAFRSASTLTPGMKYTASVSPGVADYYGNLTRNTYSTTFTIETGEASGGSVLDGFESTTNAWALAAIGHGTVGTDTLSTAFTIESSKKYDGSYGGSLQYTFDTTNANAICEVENTQRSDISGSSSFGMWVFGDNSGNELDFIFGSSQEKNVSIDTIEWYGWKYIGMWLDKSDTSTSTFRGFAIRHLQSALLPAGTVYVDDIQSGGKITDAQGKVPQPVSFALFQNYPNPFNPLTIISYRLSVVSDVTLNIYDVLGREVAALVHERQNAGIHTATFDATRLPSGVYFYRLSAASFTATMKMIVLK